MLGLILATLRTNYYVESGDGGPRPFLSIKLEPDKITELPKPRPRFEVFVYSPQVEGAWSRRSPTSWTSSAERSDGDGGGRRSLTGR